MSFLCVDVVADVDDALLLENKEETNVFPVCLAEEETFNAFAVALICICSRVRVCRADYSSKICDVCTYTREATALTLVQKCFFSTRDTSLYELTKNASISFVGEKNTTVVTVDPDRYTHI